MISAMVRTPSQRVRMAAALLLSCTIPSGYSSTCASCAGSHCRRKPPPIAGRAVVSMVSIAVPSSSLHAVLERHCIVHLPEHIQLELQDPERALLLGARAKALESRRQRELR